LANSKLAIMNIPLMRPDITEEDIQATVEVLQSGMLVQGGKVAEFEESIKSFVKVPFCAAVSNGTASLHLALHTLGIGLGDEVIVPAFSYIATANVVELVQARCVFVDIDVQTFTINVEKVRAAITEKTKAIIPVHEFGLCADMEKLMQIAREKNIFVIEDAACALGASQNGKMAGTFGDFGSFSLHPRKAITSGEGGLLTMSSRELDHKIRTMRNHGISPNSVPMDFVEAGFNYRMTDFQAALVNSQLNRIDKIIEIKRNLASLFLDLIKNPLVTLPYVPVGFDHTWQTFHIMLESNDTRNLVMAYLKNQGIFTNYGAQCIPAMSFYKKKYNLDVEREFPNAWAAYTRGLALPLYERLTEIQVRYICNHLNDFKIDVK
jgi:dTDP-4-amino-4,6-dideoxygalactose transaminase